MWAAGRLATDGGDLVVDESGSGPPVVFLSGGPGDSGGYLRPLAEPLTGQFRCLVPDLRGTGRSVLHEGATATIDDLFTDLDRLRSAAGADRVALVGHSFGATLAVLYAAARPAAVAGAALIGLGPLDARAAGEARERMGAIVGPVRLPALLAARSARKAAAASGDAVAFRRAFLTQVELSLPALVLDPEAGRRLVARRSEDLDHTPSVHAAVSASLAARDQWAAVAALRTRLLVIYGEEDFEPVRQAAEIAERVPGAEVVMLPGAAHLPWLDRPAAVTSALRAFLEAVS